MKIVGYQIIVRITRFVTLVIRTVMKIVGYQIIVRITRFVTLVIRPDYQKCCLRSTPDIVPNSGGDLWWFAMMCSGLRWFVF